MAASSFSNVSFKLLASILFLASAVRALSYGFPYGEQKVRGVNLGGWLVLEPWITPSLFDATNNSKVVDEYTYGRYAPASTAHAALKRHWDTFITEKDFAAIKNAGLNHVRLPVGYWAYDPDRPYITGQAPYVAKAVAWAKKHGLKVWVDLHGVPGSQNGFDNSGHRGEANWHKNRSNINRSQAIIARLAKQFASQSSVVTGIAVINEAASWKDQAMMDPLKQYYRDSWGATRYPNGKQKEKGHALVVLSDAFHPLDYWNGFMPPPQYDGVAIDTHKYQVFSDQGIQLSEQGHVNVSCSYAGELGRFKSLWLFAGEWSTSPNDCAKYLNGRGTGSRYDGSFPGSRRVGSCANLTGNASRFSAAYKTTLRKMFESHTIALERGTQGWMYWTWKTEAAPEWSYSAGLKGGWIPKNPTDRKYPNICG